jgi:hypothetical protein
MRNGPSHRRQNTAPALLTPPPHWIRSLKLLTLPALSVAESQTIAAIKVGRAKPLITPPRPGATSLTVARTRLLLREEVKRITYWTRVATPCLSLTKRELAAMSFTSALAAPRRTWLSLTPTLTRKKPRHLALGTSQTSRPLHSSVWSSPAATSSLSPPARLTNVRTTTTCSMPSPKTRTRLAAKRLPPLAGQATSPNFSFRRPSSGSSNRPLAAEWCRAPRGRLHS